MLLQKHTIKKKKKLDEKNSLQVLFHFKTMEERKIVLYFPSLYLYLKQYQKYVH